MVMKNRIIGLLVCLFIGSATLAGAKALVNSMYSNATMGPQGVYVESEEELVSEEELIREAMLAEYENAQTTPRRHEELEHYLTLHDAWHPEVLLGEVMDKLRLDRPDELVKNLSGGEKFRKLETAPDGTILITLPYAMKFDLPAGSPVRLHTGYSYYNRMVYYSSLTNDWKEFSVTMSGTLKVGEFDGKGFPPSEDVEALKLYINCNGTTPAAVTELKDLQLVIE
jgi:hypothetical protein